MEDAIAVLQDRIIYLTGQITLIQLEHGMGAITRQKVIETWGKEIKGLKYAQTVLKNYQ